MEMIEEILKYLKNKPNGSATSLEIETVLNISNEISNIIIKYLYNEGFIKKPRRQSRFASEPKYDVIKISEKGKEFVSD